MYFTDSMHTTQKRIERLVLAEQAAVSGMDLLFWVLVPTRNGGNVMESC